MRKMAASLVVLLAATMLFASTGDAADVLGYVLLRIESTTPDLDINITTSPRVEDADVDVTGKVLWVGQKSGEAYLNGTPVKGETAVVESLSADMVPASDANADDTVPSAAADTPAFATTVVELARNYGNEELQAVLDGLDEKYGWKETGAQVLFNEEGDMVIDYPSTITDEEVARYRLVLEEALASFPAEEKAAETAVAAPVQKEDEALQPETVVVTVQVPEGLDDGELASYLDELDGTYGWKDLGVSYVRNEDGSIAVTCPAAMEDTAAMADELERMLVEEEERTTMPAGETVITLPEGIDRDDAYDLVMALDEKYGLSDAGLACSILEDGNVLVSYPEGFVNEEMKTEYLAIVDSEIDSMLASGAQPLDAQPETEAPAESTTEEKGTIVHQDSGEFIDEENGIYARYGITILSGHNFTYWESSTSMKFLPVTENAESSAAWINQF